MLRETYNTLHKFKFCKLVEFTELILSVQSWIQWTTNIISLSIFTSGRHTYVWVSSWLVQLRRFHAEVADDGVHPQDSDASDEGSYETALLYHLCRSHYPGKKKLKDVTGPQCWSLIRSFCTCSCTSILDTKKNSFKFPHPWNVFTHRRMDREIIYYMHVVIHYLPCTKSAKKARVEYIQNCLLTLNTRRSIVVMTTLRSYRCCIVANWCTSENRDDSIIQQMYEYICLHRFGKL